MLRSLPGRRRRGRGEAVEPGVIHTSWRGPSAATNVLHRTLRPARLGLPSTEGRWSVQSQVTSMERVHPLVVI
jgi:hypothetical protein